MVFIVFDIILSLLPASFCFFFAGDMAKVCERCKHSMSIHDNHASCPLCRIAAGECSLDLDKPCGICANWTRRQWGKLRRSLIDARARSTQRGRQHWSTAFP